MFKGLSATDLHPTFRSDLIAFTAIPSEKASLLAETMVADAKELSPTPISTLANVVSKRLGIPLEQARSSVRVARSFAVRLAKTDEDPTNLVDDLLSMELITPSAKDAFLRMLNILRQSRTELTGRENRQKNMLGGGYHLTGWGVYTDFRIAFDKYDISDVDLDNYQPTITGLIPIVSLELETKLGEKEETIVLRLSEADLAKLETALKVARLQLTTMQKYAHGGK